MVTAKNALRQQRAGSLLFDELEGTEEILIRRRRERNTPDPRIAPANAVPGSEAKILLLQDRVSLGYALFNPNDPKYDGLPEDMAATLTLPPTKHAPHRFLAGDDGDVEDSE